MTSAAATETTARALARAIDERRHEIERIWLERVQSDVCTQPGVKLTELRNAMPDYLIALVRLLERREAAPPLATSAHDTWREVAREHGVMRVRIGFDITQLIHEFIVLRHVIREVAVAALQAEGSAEGLLADCIEPAIVAAVEAYVEARDHEARKTQAANIGFLIHELRNPLTTAVLAMAEVQRSARREQTRALGRLDRSLQSLTQLIDAVLLTERLEAGAVESRPSPVLLGAILDGIVDGAQAAARQKGLRFEARYDPALQVEVDAQLTRSAIQNLVDNAIKYTDAGDVGLQVQDLDDHIALHVNDTCHGLSEQELRTIFEPFKRGRTRKSGTGLGLAIARRAVEAQGGTIAAESPGPFGCHFWITLPRRARVTPTDD
jgi:signal transduction histidine kinase